MTIDEELDDLLLCELHFERTRGNEERMRLLVGFQFPIALG